MTYKEMLCSFSFCIHNSNIMHGIKILLLDINDIFDVVSTVVIHLSTKKNVNSVTFKY